MGRGQAMYPGQDWTVVELFTRSLLVFTAHSLMKCDPLWP